MAQGRQAPEAASQEAPTGLVAGRICEKADFKTPSVKLPREGAKPRCL